MKVNGQITPCTPGRTDKGCAGNAVCQWSYLIDRYQCCQADNGRATTLFLVLKKRKMSGLPIHIFLNFLSQNHERK